MGATITEKILAAHCDQDTVRPGQYVMAEVDFCLGNDVTAPIAIEEFEEAGFGEVFDRSRIALVPDHFTPNKDIKAATLSKVLRDFAREHDIEHYWEVGRVGIEHALLPEQGLVAPGELVIGADSHTCTYGALGAFSAGVGSTDLAVCFATGKVWLRVPESIKFTYRGEPARWVGGKDLILYTIGQIGVDGALYRAMEFCGPTIESLPMDDRFTMCNMAIEAGGKSGIIAPDEVTRQYCDGRLKREARYYASDEDAGYVEVHQWDVSGLSPQVAAPFLPSNARPVEELNDVEIDQVVIGSCTNGRISDLRAAAELLRGRKVAPTVRLIVFPATQQIYGQALEEGLIDVFIEAEAAVSTPTCGPCLGGHMGVLAAG
ncbi:MAG: 3-isopropylmalate dehydratase large subunit, partial [Candidatus Brocadiaceae bacterium]